MRRTALCGVTALIGVVSFGLAATTASAASMKVVAQDSTREGYEIVKVRASIDHPGRLGVQMIGYLAGGEATVTCTKGDKTATLTTAVARTVIHPLQPTLANADNCEVVARGFGPDGITIKIYA